MVVSATSAPSVQVPKRLRTWEEQLLELKRYKGNHGDCLVPSNYAEDHSLAIWVRSQRERQQTLSEERKQALQSIGFEWSPLECLWRKHYQTLVSFKKEHGHVTGPFPFEQYGTLFSWVCRQRRLHAQKSLPEEQKKLLEDLGFVWNVQVNATGQSCTITTPAIRKQSAKVCKPSKLGAIEKLAPFITCIRGTGNDDRIDKCVKGLENLIREEFETWSPLPIDVNPSSAIDRLVHLMHELEGVLKTTKGKRGNYFLHRCELLMEEYMHVAPVQSVPTRPLLWCPRSEVETILPPRTPPRGEILLDEEIDSDSMSTTSTNGSEEGTVDSEELCPEELSSTSDLDAETQEGLLRPRSSTAKGN